MRQNQGQSRRARSGFGTGTTSLLMIFTVLCFATLAMLTLSTAASNARIQQRSLQGTAALAKAEGEAAEAVAELDAALAAAPAEDPAALAASLGWQATGSPLVFQLATSMEENHQLLTEVQLQEGGPLTLVSQKTVYTGEWTPGQNGQLWNGQAGDI